MTIETYEPQAAVQISEPALQHIERELGKNPDKTAFRLFLRTSGCSGYMYETELVDSPAEEDEVFEFHGIKVFIPKQDLPILTGTEIDFIKVGLNSMFQFRNPNVTGECGCGESFSVTEES